VREGAVIDALGDAVAGSQAMKDPAEELLDGGASTLRWSRASMRGPTAAPSLSLIHSQGSHCGVEEGVERTTALGFGGENRAPVLFELKIRATVGYR
jgi:hypothetical protein